MENLSNAELKIIIESLEQINSWPKHLVEGVPPLHDRLVRMIDKRAEALAQNVLCAIQRAITDVSYKHPLASHDEIVAEFSCAIERILNKD